MISPRAASGICAGVSNGSSRASAKPAHHAETDADAVVYGRDDGLLAVIGPQWAAPASDQGPSMSRADTPRLTRTPLADAAT